MSGTLHSHDEHDLALPSGSVREITCVTTLALNPEHIITPSVYVDAVVEVAKPVNEALLIRDGVKRGPQ